MTLRIRGFFYIIIIIIIIVIRGAGAVKETPLFSLVKLYCKAFLAQTKSQHYRGTKTGGKNHYFWKLQTL